MAVEALRDHHKLAVYVTIELYKLGVMMTSKQHNRTSVQEVRQLPLDYRFTIPEEYLDHNGHMNVRWYMAISNDAIPAFFKSLGIERLDFRAQGSGIFALQHHLQYLAEVRVGETVAIHTRIVGFSPKRMHFMQFMINESSNKLACTIEVLNSHIDLTIRRTSPYPPPLAQRIAAVLAEQQQLAWEAPICGSIRA